MDPQGLLTAEQRRKVNELLAEFKHVFALNPKQPGTTHAIEAKFDLKPGVRPHKHPPRKMGDMAREIIDDTLNVFSINSLSSASRVTLSSILHVLSKLSSWDGSVLGNREGRSPPMASVTEWMQVDASRVLYCTAPLQRVWNATLELPAERCGRAEALR